MDADAERRDELLAKMVGDQTPSTGRIRLVGYDPAWPVLFEREASSVRNILGAGALRLEHVGSTSVPGLAAKPIIDMVLAVADSSDETSYVPKMESGGYVLRIREPDWHQHRLLKGPATDVNLHVFSNGCPEIDRMLLFRDWLRDHPEDRERYETAKRRLAERDWAFVQDYADAKSGIVEEILARAGSAF